jgi:anti-sigma B factor antagonist
MPSRIDIDRSQSSPTAFGISQHTHDAHTSVISVEGELDLATAPSLKETLLSATHNGADRLIVDLSLTAFIDSTTLGVLIDVSRGLDAGARMAIVCARPNVLKIFELAGLDGIFAIFPTLDAALAHVRENETWAS